MTGAVAGKRRLTTTTATTTTTTTTTTLPIPEFEIPVHDLMNARVFFMDVFETFGDFPDNLRSSESVQHSRRQRSHFRIGGIRQQHVAHRPAASLQQDDQLILTVDAAEVFDDVFGIAQLLYMIY